MKINIEVTDTFGGEANYCWVKRQTIEADEKISDRAVIRRCKKAAEVNYRHRKTDFGDMIRLDFEPGGWLAVMFITFGDN
jgi:hypothetical protein